MSTLQELRKSVYFKRYLLDVCLWRDTVNGNTYFSARLYDRIKDVELRRFPFQYGGVEICQDLADEYLKKRSKRYRDMRDKAAHLGLSFFFEIEKGFYKQSVLKQHGAQEKES